MAVSNCWLRMLNVDGLLDDDDDLCEVANIGSRHHTIQLSVIHMCRAADMQQLQPSEQVRVNQTVTVKYATPIC